MPQGPAISTISSMADVWDAYRDEIDGVIVSLPNFGDELGIINALHWAKLGLPVLVHLGSEALNLLKALNIVQSRAK